MEQKESRYLTKCFPSLEQMLYNEILEHGSYHNFEPGAYVVRQGAYIDFLPIILKGVIKLYAEEDGVEFLLYYIQSGESCILSFNHLFDRKPLQFSAVTEEDTCVLGLPVAKVKEWFIKYPSFSRIIIKDFQRNFEDLLQTAKEFVCLGIEDRLIRYLQHKSKLRNTVDIHLSHQAIATDLGTSREVISRITKKLEKDGFLLQHRRHIELMQL
ncbi:MAG: Crp/Fnr family transcriptional regulator [Bacteroidota bacterium]